IALAVGRDQPYAFAPLESEVDAREGRHQMRCHGQARFRCTAKTGAAGTTKPGTAEITKLVAAETKCAASPGGTERHFIWRASAVNTGKHAPWFDLRPYHPHQTG